MTRARRTADVAAAYGAVRTAIIVLDDVLEHQPLGELYATVPDVHDALDHVTRSRNALRAARDLLFEQWRHDVDPLERLELELDRAADEVGIPTEPVK